MYLYFCLLICMVICLGKKSTIHQVTTMLATSKNVLFPGYNHLLTSGADDPTLLSNSHLSQNDQLKVHKSM